MAIIHIDPSRPTNGDGSLATPFNVHPAITSNNSYLFKSGTTYVPATEIFANNVDNVIFDTYDWTFGSAGRPIIDVQTAIDGVHLRGCTNSTVNNLDVTSTNRVANSGINIDSPAAKASQNITVNNCRASNFNYVGFFAQNVGGNDSNNPLLINIVFNDCYAYQNRQHNYHMRGCVGAGCAYNRCISDGAGRSWEPVSQSFGAHGFSSHPNRFSTAAGSWTLVSGTTYKLTNTLAQYVNKIYFTAVTPSGGDTPASNVYHITTKNVATPTTPAQGEFGISGNDIYVNSDWTTYTPDVMVSVVPISPFAGITYTDCIAFDTRDVSTTLGEGHGFDADDTSNDNTYIRCVSYSNEGYGFMSNQGDNTTHIGCVSMYNDTQNRVTGAFKAAYAKNVKYIHCTGGLSLTTAVGAMEYDMVVSTYTIQNCLTLRNANRTSLTGIYGYYSTITKPLRGNVYHKTGDTNATADETGAAIPIVFKNNPSPTNVDFTLDEASRAVSNCPFAPESAGITSLTGELFNRVGTAGAYTLPYVDVYNKKMYTLN